MWVDITHQCHNKRLYNLLSLSFKDELNALVNGLILNLNDKRLIEPSICDFTKAQNLNIEANALTYLLIVLIVVFLYDEQHQQQSDIENHKFSFKYWLTSMQNYLSRIQDYAYGM